MPIRGRLGPLGLMEPSIVASSQTLRQPALLGSSVPVAGLPLPNESGVCPSPSVSGRITFAHRDCHARGAMVLDFNKSNLSRERFVSSGRPRVSPWILFLGTAISLTLSADVRSQSLKEAHPPAASVRPVTETLYGIRVEDDYRYMENLEDPEVQSWLKRQNGYTRAVLDSLPGRQTLFKQIVVLDESTSGDIDRKSTRLNSSHQIISYAVFCLKKKKKDDTSRNPQAHIIRW